MSGTRSVVSLPAFQRLLVARTISSIGNGMAPIALAFGVLALPGATPTSLSIVLAAQAIPVVVLLNANCSDLVPNGCFPLGTVAAGLGRCRCYTGQIP